MVFRNIYDEILKLRNYFNRFPQNIKIEKPVFQKMMFLTNALEEGWSIRKSMDSYIFTKKHENKRKYFRKTI